VTLRVPVALAILILSTLALAPSAGADIGVRLGTRDVRVGGTLRGWSNGSGFPVYIVPSTLAPKRHSCHGGTAMCEPTVKRPPGNPFVLLGHVPGRIGDYGKRPFAFHVPRVRPGVYRVFVYCRPCGGSLIQSGSRIDGETIRIRVAGLPLRLARAPYVGLACRTPNSPVCGRIGIAVWLRRPALGATAVLGGVRVKLHAGGLGGRGPKYWEGYVQLPRVHYRQSRTTAILPSSCGCTSRCATRGVQHAAGCACFSTQVGADAREFLPRLGLRRFRAAGVGCVVFGGPCRRAQVECHGKRGNDRQRK